MRGVIRELKAERRRLSKALGLVEKTLGRLGAGAVKRRKRRVVARKAAKPKTADAKSKTKSQKAPKVQGVMASLEEKRKKADLLARKRAAQAAAQDVDNDVA